MLFQFSVMNSIFELLLFIVMIFNSFIMKSWSPELYYNISWVEISLSLMSVILLSLINLSESNHNIVVLSRGITLLSVLFFGAQSLMMMYMAYESLMYFILLIIFLYGSQPEKVAASFYMICYTGSSSLPFMYVIFNLESWPCSIVVSPFFGSLMLMIFVAKAPIFMLHLWLPKAHVEAPTTGSMLLAGILLKVGVYGFMKVLTMINFSLSWISLFSFMGFLFAGMFSLSSSDTKVLSAYSSVVHMNLVLYGLNLVSLCNSSASLTLSVAHGFVSTLLFYMVGMLYSTNGSRIIYLSSGLSSYYPYLLLLFLGVIAGNMGVPPLLSFWGELVMLVNIFSGIGSMMLVSMVYFMYTMLYSMYLFMHTMKSITSSSVINPMTMVVLVWVLFLLFMLL